MYDTVQGRSKKSFIGEAHVTVLLEYLDLLQFSFQNFNVFTGSYALAVTIHTPPYVHFL